MKKVLIIRMSALGDVAMTIPVIYSVAKRYPDTRFTVLTQAFPANFFINPPANVSILTADTRGEYRGVKGLIKLVSRLKRERFDAVADLHDVLRSKVIRTAMRLSGIPAAFIDKGRKEKKALVRAVDPVRRQLDSSFDRYAEVFRSLGFSFESDFRTVFGETPADTSFLKVTGEKTGNWIGFAPFAKHAGKILPMEKCEELIAALSQNPQNTLFLFGAGAGEKSKLEEWSGRYPHTVSLAGKIRIREEIALMSYLDVMVSMDSANMHLASLTATPVVSIWGATHPYTGFLGWNQSPENAVGLPMDCRPCSVFGNKPCRTGDYACLTRLSIKPITDRINAIIEQRNRK